ncbi:MAG: PIN domain-containing protein [Acidobacteria bacterium]|nr:PIN domain-containing protein [Acidobacteriota bacterium]
MTCLLDTHFVVWIALDSSRLKKYPWLPKYQPWVVSPVSLLEIQFLVEAGRGKVDSRGFAQAIMADPRFQVDDAPLATLIQKALGLSWTRDPFDRLIAAHSLVRRVPLCSVDAVMLDNHKPIVHELHQTEEENH